jgi:hypothetical protein
MVNSRKWEKGKRMKRNLQLDEQNTETSIVEEKGVIIEQLRDRARIAFEKEFYIETIFISTVILEERIYSVNSKIDGRYPRDKNSSRKTLGNLITDFKSFYTNNDGLKRHFNITLVNDLDWYLEFRNNIYHLLISDGLVTSTEDLKQLAEFATRTSEEFRATTRRWKKKEF